LWFLKTPKTSKGRFFGFLWLLDIVVFICPIAIPWDRLSNQFLYVCMYVCMYVCTVSVGTLTVAFLTDLHEIW